MTSCARVERRLPALVDRGEPGDLALYRHVRSCPSCRDRLTQYRELRRTLRGLDGDGAGSGGAARVGTAGSGTAGSGAARAAARDDTRLVRSALAGAAGVSGAIALALALRRRVHSAS